MAVFKKSKKAGQQDWPKKANLKQSQAFNEQVTMYNDTTNSKGPITAQMKALGLYGPKYRKMNDDFREEFYRNWLKFYKNSFKFVGDDELERLKDEIVLALWLGGRTAIFKDVTNRPVLGGLTNRKENGYKELTSATFIPSFGEKKRINVKGSEVVEFQAQTWAIPLKTGIDVYIDRIIQAIGMIGPDLENSLVKLVGVVDTVSEQNDLQKEAAIDNLMSTLAFANDHSLIRITDKKVTFQEISAQSINQILWSNINKWINLSFMLRGRTINTMSDKKERVTAGENELNEKVFQSAIDDFYYYLQKAVDQYNVVFGKNVTLDKVQLTPDQTDEVGYDPANTKGGNKNETNTDNKVEG